MIIGVIYVELDWLPTIQVLTERIDVMACSLIPCIRQCMGRLIQWYTSGFE